MMRNFFNYRVGLVLLGAVLLGVFYGQASKAEQERSASMTPPAQTQILARDEIIIRKASGEELPFTVELALSPIEQEQGLMHRTALADNTGMLFIFGDEARRSFWMKNTLIPLDILFLKNDGRIHHIHSNARPQDESLITSNEESRAVLELCGGTADRLGIESGDQVLYKVFRNIEVD